MARGYNALEETRQVTNGVLGGQGKREPRAWTQGIPL